MVTVGEVALVVLLEQVHRVDPGEPVLARALLDQALSPRDVAAQQPHHRLCFPAPIGDEEDKVVLPGARRLLDARYLSFQQMTVERPGHPGESLCTRTLRDECQLVQLAPAHELAAGHSK